MSPKNWNPSALLIFGLAFILTACGGGPNSSSTLGSDKVPQSGTFRPPSSTPPPPISHGPGQIPPSRHVFVVVEENHKFSEVYPHGMPWLVSKGDAYGFASNYHANASGSMLDYLWLSSGSSESAFGCEGWGCRQPITSNNIFRELKKAGLTWKVYAESLPSVGYMGMQSGAYLKRHNPAPWYSDVINSLVEQRKMVPFTFFASDMAAGRLPNYSIIIPNVLHDAHDGTLAAADIWLQQNVGPVLKRPFFQTGGDGLLIVTFDECDGGTNSGCGAFVYTALIGPQVKRGTNSTNFYRHENTLRTILDSLGATGYPGASNGASSMSDFF